MRMRFVTIAFIFGNIGAFEPIPCPLHHGCLDRSFDAHHISAEERLCAPCVMWDDQWTVSQLSNMIIYNSAWSILILWIIIIMSDDNV